MFRLAVNRQAARFMSRAATTNGASMTRFYHGSSIMEGGRKTGSSALEPAFRDWSRSQLKRNAARRKEREAKVDFGKKKMKENAAVRKIKSPQMDEYIQKLQVELFPGVREMMLPEGSALLEHGLGAAATRDLMGEEEVSPAMFVEELREFLDMTAAQAGADTQTGNELAVEELSLSDVNKLREQAYIVFKLYGMDSNFEEMAGLLELLKRLRCGEEVPGPAAIPITVYNEYLRVAVETGRFEQVLEIFNGEIAGSPDAELSSSIPDGASLVNSTQTVAERVRKHTANMDTWSWFVQAVARSGRPDEALAHIDRLERGAGLQVHTDMYNSVLASLVESRRFDDATALWDRMHCTPDLVPNNGSFEIVLNLCALTNQAERAFYVLDELRALGLSPDAKVFSALFRACAEAPHHVSGYEDTVEEAMCLMEGAEIYPTSEVYDSIIYAFSASGDYVSAEFYFWEMRRKGLPASTTTYANLLRAYARNSALGLSSWGYQGRFLKRPEKLNEKQKLVRKIPPGKLSKMMSEDLFSTHDDESRFRMGEAVLGNSAGRKKPDIFDDLADTAGADLFMEQMRAEAGRHPDPPAAEHPPAPPVHGAGGFAWGEEAAAVGGTLPLPSSSSSSSLSSRRQAKEQTTKARDSSGLGELGLELAGADDGTADLAQMMGDPAAMQAMMSGLSPEEQAEFGQLLGQFGLSGDLDDIGAELAGGAAPGGGVDVEARPLPAEPKLEDLFSGTDDPQAFDELLQQLSRIESESDGRTSLDKLMQQFMMSEAAAAGHDVLDGDEEEEGDEDIGADADAEVASFRDKAKPAAAPRPAAQSYMAASASSDGEDDGAYISSRRIPTHCSLVFSAPADHSSGSGSSGGEGSEAAPSAAAAAPSLLAGLLDGADENAGLANLGGAKTLPAGTFEAGLVPGQQVFSQKAISSEWDMIEFGRVPSTDYSQVPVLQRRAENVEKAEAAYRYMQECDQGCEITVEVLNSLLACYTEALMAAGARSVIKEEFAKHGLALNSQSYQHLVRMQLRKKDLEGTLQTMEDMKAVGVAPSPDTWGLVIDAFAARNKPVEALKVIDELAATYPATIKDIPDGYLKRTRLLCRRLAVEHPELPTDPEQWVRDVKLNRRRMKLASKSKIQPLRSLLYTS